MKGGSMVSWDRREFFKLWSAQATGLVGQTFSMLAMPLVAILTLHASPSTVALLVACFNLPTLLFGLFAGVVIDRLPRRSVLIVADIGRAVILCSIPICAALGVLTLGQLFALSVVVGTLDLGWMTAYRSYVPTVVPAAHLSRAYAMVGASDGVTRTAAPSLAGAAVQFLGAPMGLSVTSVCYFLSGLFNSRIRAVESPDITEQQEPVLQAFRDGLAYVWRHAIIRAFAVSEASYILFWSATQSVLLVFLSRNLHLSPGVIGLIFTIGTVGGIVAAFVARRIGNRVGPGPAIVVGSALRSIGMALLPVAIVCGPLAIPALMAARLVNAFGWTLWDVHRETVQQQLTPDRYRGRANSSVLFLSGAALTVGSAMGAGLVALTGIPATLTICGVGTLFATGWLLAPRLWTMRTAVA
jgi:MFS family permease